MHVNIAPEKEMYMHSNVDISIWIVSQRLAVNTSNMHDIVAGLFVDYHRVCSQLVHDFSLGSLSLTLHDRGKRQVRGILLQRPTQFPNKKL